MKGNALLRAAALVAVTSLGVSTAVQAQDGKVIDCETVFVRPGPGSKYKAIDYLVGPRGSADGVGESVKVLEQGAWHRIEPVAWVHAQYVQPLEGVEGRVTGDGVVIRDRASQSGIGMGSLNTGDLVRIDGQEGDYVRLQAYVYSKYIQVVEVVAETAPLPIETAIIPLETEDVDEVIIADQTPQSAEVVILPTEEDLATVLIENEDEPTEADLDALLLAEDETFVGPTEEPTIAGTYALKLGGLFGWMGEGPEPEREVVIEPTADADIFEVTHTVTHVNERPRQYTGLGTWDGEKLEVAFDPNRVGATHKLTAQQVKDCPVTGSYRLLATTGELKGKFDRGYGRVKEVGFNVDKVHPIEGEYTLKPNGYNPDKLFVALAVVATGDPTRVNVNRKLIRPDGRIEQDLVGVGRVDLLEREVEIDFGRSEDVPKRYTLKVRENGQAKATYYLDDTYTKDKGWRNDVPQEDIPNALERAWAKVIAFLKTVRDKAMAILAPVARVFQIGLDKAKQAMRWLLDRGKDAYLALVKAWNWTVEKAKQFVAWVVRKVKGEPNPATIDTDAGEDKDTDPGEDKDTDAGEDKDYGRGPDR